MATLAELLASTKTKQSDGMRLSAMLDIAKRAKADAQGKSVQDMIAEVPASVYNNPIANAAIGFTPVIGDIQSGVEALRSAAAGRWGEAALNGLGVLPFVPAMAGMVKGMGNVEDALKAGGKTQYDLAHEVAQRNAALPVEQGGLGLPPDNTAMDRALAMGAVDAYHGTNHDITSISMDMAGTKTGNPNAALGFFTTPNTTEASRYAVGWGKDGANVMPLMVMPDNTYQMPFKELDDLAMLPYRKMMADPSYDKNKVIKFGDMQGQKEAAERTKRFNEEARIDVLKRKNELLTEGFDSAVVNKGKPTEEFIAMNPAIVRSRFAAFDPMRRNESDLLAGLAPLMIPTTLAGLLTLGAASGFD